MPVILRTPYKFVSKGINLTNPPDLLPPGYQPRLMNAVVGQEGTLSCRAGASSILTGLSQTHGHSLYRLNNLDPSYSALNDILLAGFGTNLYSGDPLSASPISSGFSGYPLSCAIFRPDQSTAAWAYLADQNKMVKVDVNSTVRNIGIASPSVAPVSEVGVLPVQSVILSSYSSTGTVTAVSFPTRVPAATTVSAILYDTGATGWACLSPSTPTGDYSWLQPGERLILNAAEEVTAAAVLPEIPATTIASILFDSGTTGLCSITLASRSPQIARNSLLILVGEVVRVLSVSSDSQGNISFRCVTTNNYVPGNAVTGIVSIRAFTTTTIAAGQAITSPNTVEMDLTAGVGAITSVTAQPDFSVIGGRQVGADDYMHVSIWVDNPALLTEGRIMMDVDRTTNDFTKNYYYKTFRANDLTNNALGTQTAVAALPSALTNTVFATADPRNASTQLGLGSGQWTELTFRISDLIRVGSDGTRSLANVAAVRFQITCTGTIVCRFNSWYTAGTYGTDVALGSPTGIYYFYRYRSTATGTRSNPSPTTRYQLFPSRQPINITMTSSPDAQVDVIDIYRYDPSLQSANTSQATIVYIATVPNGVPSYSDQNMASLIAANESMRTDLFQPWPVLAAPLTGTCNVSGTTVKWVSGSQFPLAMVPGTVITIGAVNSQDNQQTYSYPVSSTFLETLTNSGNGTGVAFHIYSPLLAGQPLPVIFGPLEGPTASFLFGLGDPLNPGTLYWTNGNDPDSASDKNTLDITSPSEPLIGGCVWNTLVYVFSRERVFLVRPSFDASGTFTFTFYAIPAASGLWSAWFLCAAAEGIFYGGRDGIYLVSGEQVSSITDLTLYPLFPHPERAGQTTNSYPAVDMTQIPFLRLNFAAGNVWFHYKDVNGLCSTMMFDRSMKGWFPQSWPQQVTSVYSEITGQSVASPRLLMTTNTGSILSTGNSTDDGAAVMMTVRTPSMDNGDPRLQKLYVDLMTDYAAINPGTVVVGYNNHQITLPSAALAAQSRGQARTTISTINGTLALYLNISAEYSFPFGTSLFESEPAGYIQPYLSNSFISRQDHGFPDWQCLRDGLFAIISTTTVTLLIDIDGVQTSYNLATTNGNLRKVYQLLRHASKGRMFIWQLQSPSPFVLFPAETVVRMKSWTGDFIDVKPFAGSEPG